MPSGRAQVACFPTADALTADAAGRFVSVAAQAVRERGRFLVSLAGGSTPRGLYEALATSEAASNYRLARITLLDRVAIPAANVHRMRGEDAPDQAAAAYERELRLALGADKAAMLHRVLEGPIDLDALPAQAIAPRDGALTWVVDAAAATALQGIR